MSAPLETKGRSTLINCDRPRPAAQTVSVEWHCGLHAWLWSGSDRAELSAIAWRARTYTAAP